MKQWDVICFDLDDTLIDYERTFRAAISHCFTTFCRNKDIDFSSWFRVFKSFCDQYWPEYACGRLTRMEYRRLRFLEAMRTFHIKADTKTADEFHAYFDDIVGRHAIVMPDIVPLLEQLQKLPVQLGIITNGKSAIQREKIVCTGLHRFFPDHAIIISEEIGSEKPDAAIFRCALHRLACGRQQSVYIGDSWELDVMGALNAGWQAIYLNRQKNAPVNRMSSVMICNNAKELASILLGEFHLVERRERRL